MEVQGRNSTRLSTSNTSGYRGVHPYRNKWRAAIKVSSKTIFIGIYTTKIEAAKARDRYVIENALEHTLNGLV